MTLAVSKKLGISQDAADALIESNPQKFNQTVQTLLKEGKFNDPSSPNAGKYIQMYLEAYDRRVKPGPLTSKSLSLSDAENTDVAMGAYDYLAHADQTTDDAEQIIFGKNKPVLDGQSWTLFVGSQPVRDYFSHLASQTEDAAPMLTMAADFTKPSQIWRPV